MRAAFAYILSASLFFCSWTIWKNNSYQEEKVARLYVPDVELIHQKHITHIPEDLTFAGEPIHFKTPEAYGKYYNELKINTTKSSTTRLLLRNVNMWLPSIEKTLKDYNIPEDFKYLAVAESNLTINVVSHKGAAGFWQFTEPTALDYGLEVNDEIDERYNWYRSTVAACRYFKQAYKRLGSWTSAAASYNRGIGGYELALQRQNVNSYYDLQLNKETSKYIYKILALKDFISSPSKYRMSHSRTQRIPVNLIKIDTSIQDLKKYTESMNLDYDLVKAYNPWILKNSLTIKKPNSYYYLSVPPHARIIVPHIADTNRVKEAKGLSFYLLYSTKKHS